jgi:hypothetical protein
LKETRRHSAVLAVANPIVRAVDVAALDHEVEIHTNLHRQGGRCTGGVDTRQSLD